MKNFNELNMLELDVMREIASICTGNAATSLSSILGQKIKLISPNVHVLDFTQARDLVGEPEDVSSAVLAVFDGEIKGIMLSLQQLEFVNVVLENLMGKTVTSYDEIDEIDKSALLEVGNIMISTFMNALTSFVNISAKLSVPAFTVDMQGALMQSPMAILGSQSDHVMIVTAELVCEGKVIPAKITLLPDVKSLNYLLEKLGVLNE